MKTAIYIEDGVVQLVLTPEGEFEVNALSSFIGSELSVKIFSGTFYDCRGGWTRQTEINNNPMMIYSDQRARDSSIILRVEK